MFLRKTSNYKYQGITHVLNIFLTHCLTKQIRFGFLKLYERKNRKMSRQDNYGDQQNNERSRSSVLSQVLQ